MAWWIFQNLVTTAALAAAVAIVCRFARIGPVARHALWVLVLVKFITPPLVVWPWAAPDPLGLARFDARVVDRQANVVMSEAPAIAIDGDALTPAPEVVERSVTVPSSTSAPAPNGGDIWFWVVAIWVAGSVCLLSLEVTRLVRLARRVRSATAADPAIDQRVKALAHRLGINPVPVVTLAGSTSPVVWCLGRPQLLWPGDLDIGFAGPAGPAGSAGPVIDGLIVHELAHIKRRDHIVGWIELVAGVVWWWNPLFWSVRSALREQAELACDAWVISALPNGRRAYAESLLALSSLGAAPSTSMSAVMGVRASSRRVLERRLVMIMKGRAPLRLPSAGLLTLAVMALATLPAWATGTNGDRQQVAQVAQQTAQPVQASTQPAQVVQPTQAAAQPQQGQTKPAPVTTATKPSQAPTTTHPTTVIHTATPTTARTVRVEPGHAATTTHVVTAQGPTKAVVPVEGQEKRRQPVWSIPDGQTLHRFQWFAEPSQLTDEGQKIVAGLEAEREAIQKEADAKIDARREATIKQLQALQDQYAKAGKLDEAVAIRDYLKAGGPANPKVGWIIKRNP